MQDKVSDSILVVDLDGTLIRTDLLHESLLMLVKHNPLYLFALPLWLLKGKAHLKQMIADRVDLPVNLLPYNRELVEHLREERQAGRKIMLATASNSRYAEAVASHLEVFDFVLASDANNNFSGNGKLNRIREMVGSVPFSYAGNSSVDLPIWAAAEEAVLVDVPRSVRDKAVSSTKLAKVFESKRSYVKAFWRAIRPHQWLKNLLLFVPLVLAHQLDIGLQVWQATLGFIAFSLCASSVYLLNDLLDLPADRQHPTKRLRPFAAGDLPVAYGVVGLVALLAAAVFVALQLPNFFVFVLTVYYFSTLAYSIWLKQAVLVDALLLAGLYTLRLIAGAAAISVTPSFWLLAFSMFTFLSLALIKRYSELQLLHARGQGQLVGRSYRFADMETLAQLGASSGYLAVLVLAFYINSSAVFELYSRPEFLWLLCPMMLYWISRMWLLARRHEMHEDPVVFTMTDRRTYWLALIASITLGFATFWPFVVDSLPWLFE
jgi:4-hydroxybenzoate polyprenyltransferase/phosphoserine phosphatase